ncbi:TX [Lepeophtheirus salmonis]|uniref:TX n=1 Tax=Lepeophtheirus salmonis TaxID=72036 RepID=A0A7R8H4Q4_LEPSM|nr:myosin-G heavy chain-like [Lepeophtheirus salmonis]CAB4060397.1 TX [Lepeophtheirus salmonis]CAF2864921.1 TX [Lepeophtheirus salmonis]
MSYPEDESLTLPIKSRSLRAKSIAKRLETERNKNAPRVRKPRQKVCTMSKYRRKTANAKERDRMKQVNDAFEKLRDVVPHHRAFIGVATSSPPPPTPGDPASATKVSTLRCAISYINSLQQLIEDSNKGLLDPNLYNTDLVEEETDVLFSSLSASSKKPNNKPLKKAGGKKSKLKKNSGATAKDSKSNNKRSSSASGAKSVKKKKQKLEETKKLISNKLMGNINNHGHSGFSTNNILQENLFTSYLIPQQQTHTPLNPTQISTLPNPGAYYSNVMKERHNPSLLPLQPLYLPSSPLVYKTPDSLYGDMDSFSDVSSASPGSTSSSSLDLLLHPQDFSSPSSSPVEDFHHPASSSSSCANLALNSTSSHILDDIQQILKDAENFDIMV